MSKWASLMMARLWWLVDRVRGFLKLLHLWSVAGLQWSVSIKGGTGGNHWEQSLYALIQQTSYCRQSVKFFCLGLNIHRPVRVPVLTPVHCREHQQWACEYQNWTKEQWRKVAWSDEVPFLLHQMDGHHLSREYLPPCTMGGRKASRGRVMFWGLFCWETKSNGKSAAI